MRPKTTTERYTQALVTPRASAVSVMVSPAASSSAACCTSTATVWWCEAQCRLAPEQLRSSPGACRAGWRASGGWLRPGSQRVRRVTNMERPEQIVARLHHCLNHPRTTSPTTPERRLGGADSRPRRCRACCRKHASFARFGRSVQTNRRPRLSHRPDRLGTARRRSGSVPCRTARPNSATE